MPIIARGVATPMHLVTSFSMVVTAASIYFKYCCVNFHRYDLKLWFIIGHEINTNSNICCSVFVLNWHLTDDSVKRYFYAGHKLAGVILKTTASFTKHLPAF